MIFITQKKKILQDVHISLQLSEQRSEILVDLGSQESAEKKMLLLHDFNSFSNLSFKAESSLLGILDSSFAFFSREEIASVKLHSRLSSFENHLSSGFLGNGLSDFHERRAV